MARWSKFRPNRRAFLGGAAAMVGLPWLPSIASADTTPAPPPKRLVFWYVPNGMNMEAFVPVDTGPTYTMSSLLQPLAAHRDELLVLSNLGHAAAAGLGGHARGTAAFLTGIGVPGASEPIQVGPSADVLASTAPAATQTRFPSLQLGVGTAPGAGTCDSGYSCAYQNTISWSDATTPVPVRTDPVALFDTLFGGLDSTLTQVERQRRHLRRSSVLDYVREEATTLSGRLSVDDRQKLDQYLTGVRALEQQLGDGVDPVCDPGTPATPPSGYPDHVDVMTELMVKAIECDASRVLSFMADKSGSYRSFSFMGIGSAHHEVSHWGFGDEATQATRKAAYTQICNWHIQRFASLLNRLAARVEWDGTTLLDNCTILFGSEIGNGHTHDHAHLPILLAGGGNLQTGKHLRFATPERVSNILIGMLDEFGASVPVLGDSTVVPAGVFSP